MLATLDPTTLTRIFAARDARALEACCERAPEFTLVHLDGSMRGLRDGPLSPEQTAWLVEQDLRLRRHLGWAQRLADLHILRGAYGGGDLYLVIGAGISMGAGMPGWKDLVLEILDYASTFGTADHRAAVEANLRRSIQGPPEIVDQEVERTMQGVQPASAELRREVDESRRRLRDLQTYDSEVLLKASFAAGRCFGDRYLNRLRDVLYSRRLKRTELHPAIARMVRPKARPWPPTPRIFAIATYNFDDLIEQALREEGHGFTVHCSQRGTMVWNRGETRDRPSAVDVYHLHGIAPGGWLLDLDGIDLVFTTEQYTAQYGEERNFARAVQASFFRNAPGLILGASLEDRYAVHELEDAHRKSPGWFNYVVLQLPAEHRGAPASPSAESVEQLGARYRTMGLRVLWIRDFAEIPRLLDFIRGEDVSV